MKNEYSKSASSNWLGINTPRYTSYPTAPNFNQEINARIYDKWLSNIENDSDISLYIHIPFCKQLCWFCGCTTKASNYYQQITSYVQLLLKEIELLAGKVNFKAQISDIHFGGGSPTILIPSDFTQIIDTIKQNFLISPNLQSSIEIDPRNVDSRKITFYGKSKIDRVSIGIQDFNYNTQMAINRFQSFEMIEDVFNELRKNKINNINVDLIYGLPYQTRQSMLETVNKVLKLNPNRIALFSYAHIPHIKKHQKLIDQSKIVSDEERLEIFRNASKTLQYQGYRTIGIDHFAKVDDELTTALKAKTLKRNFQGYSANNTASYIGVGLSSISKLKQGYAQNTTEFEEYKKALNNNQLPISRGKAISKEDKIRKEIIDSLMCFMEVDLKAIIDKYNLKDDYFDQELNKISVLHKDIAKINNKDIKAISKHKMSVRVIAAIFDQYLQNNQTKYSKVV
jgi:oxygen-independent coproporphyrinogen-3 oxidase